MQKPVRTVLVELTNNCNYRCPSCPQSIWQKPDFLHSPFDRPRGFMAFDLFRNIVDQAFECAEEINFSYFGEPMMHPDFVPMMNYLKNRPPGLRVVMNTNLSYASAEVFQTLIDIELDDLRISLDAADGKTYEVVRPGRYFVDLDGTSKKGDRYDTIVGKAAYWHSLEGHSPTRHVYTVSSLNEHHILPYAELWQPHLGVRDVILFKNVLTYGGKMGDPLIKVGPCNNWRWRSLTIDWSGRISACHLDTNMELEVAHTKDISLKDVFESSAYQAVKKASLERTITPCDTCVDSNYWDNTVRVFHDTLLDHQMPDNFIGAA